MTALYTFAVVDDDPSLLDRCAGDQPLRLVSAGGVAAVVEPVDVGDYEGARLEQNLNDRSWLERAVRHHETVIEELLPHTAVVPMRFGSIFSSEAGLAAMLGENAAHFGQLLTGLRGRREWGVRVVADVNALTKELAPAAQGAVSGRDYLRRRQAQLQVADQLSDVGTRLATEIHERLAAAAESAAVLTPRRPDPSVLMSTAYLVALDDEERFLAQAAELNAAHAGVELAVTGPWPAYSFVSADVGGPRG